MRKGSEDRSLTWGAGTLNHRWPLRLPPVFVDAAHLGSVGRNITAATTLGMAQHHEEAASDVNNLQVVLICCRSAVPSGWHGDGQHIACAVFCLRRDPVSIAMAWAARFGAQPHPFICIQTPTAMPAPGAVLIADFWISTVS